MERSLRWARRSRDAFVEREGYGIYGIVQGGADRELRTTSIEGLKKIGFDGYAIGGDLSINDGWELMFSVLDYLTPMMPHDKPRYLMGVGKPIDEKCNCRACKQHTRAYIHHLFKADEILGAMLMTEHNIMYYQDLMRGIRKAIEEKRYRQFVEEFMRNRAIELY